MLEDKKLGLKIAENQDEALWYRLYEGYVERRRKLKQEMKGHKEALKDSDRKIVQKVREGARREIKEIKDSLKLNEEFIKFTESKYKEKSNAKTEKL